MKRFTATVGVALLVASSVHAANGANDYLLSVSSAKIEIGLVDWKVGEYVAV
jgi:hypothetical protein